MALIRIRPYDFTNAEFEELTRLKPWTANSWNNGSDAIKRIRNNLRQHLMTSSQEKCCYCGNLLDVTSSLRIDHVAPKSEHPQFTYEAKNLVPSCQYCNETRKRALDTINAPVNDVYEQCDFIIVHPVIDDPAQHIRENGYTIEGLTDKGRKSIEVFDLANERRMHVRMNEYIIRRLNLLPVELRDQIRHIIEPE